MKIIYAKNGEKVKGDGQIRNPDYYVKPVIGAESVLIYGNYPQIEADYKAIGITPKVTESIIKKAVLQVSVGITPELQKLVDDAKAECEKVQKENEALSEQLKDHELVVAQRDALVIENEALKAQIAESQKPVAENVDLLGDNSKDPKNKK